MKLQQGHAQIILEIVLRCFRMLKCSLLSLDIVREIVAKV